MTASGTGTGARAWWVYILRCRDGSLYTGITNDMARRLKAHGDGRGAAYTRARRPLELVYTEPAADRGAASRRESALKRLTRAEKQALVAGGTVGAVDLGTVAGA